MQPIAFLQNLSSWEIILIFLVVLLFFGAKRLPELFRSFGKSLKEFKKATTDIEEDFRTAMEEDEEDNKPAKVSSQPATTAPKEAEPEEVENDDIAERTDKDDDDTGDSSDETKPSKS